MSEVELVGCTGALADTVVVSQNSLVFQISLNAGQTTSLALRNMHTSNLGVWIENLSVLQSLAEIDITGFTGAQDAMHTLDQALEGISSTSVEIYIF